jgi:hypothetical protein
MVAEGNFAVLAADGDAGFWVGGDL